MAALDQAEQVAGPLTAPLQVSHSSGEWLQVLPHLDPVYGGLTAVVPRLARELVQVGGVSVRVAAFCLPGEERFSAGEPGISTWPLSRSSWASGGDVTRAFRAEVERCRGVHIHGLWESSTQQAAAAARQFRRPYVLSAHGMLERWALRNKRWKKEIYARLFEHRNVRGAACLHALTEAEAADYRRFGCSGPIAVIPNGVEADRSATPRAFLDAFPMAQGKELLLFLGRIHYKKGVDLLVKAWAEIAADFPEALLVMAGPDSEDTLAKVQETVKRLHLEHRVLFTGMLSGPLKWSALAAANCFVLPSYSEGLSVAVLEALSMGLPVVLSRECNLPQVEPSGAGWLVATDSAALAGALRAALTCSPAERQRVQCNAQSLAEREFGWNSVAGRMAEVYRWITDGPMPVHTQILRENA